MHARHDDCRPSHPGPQRLYRICPQWVTMQRFERKDKTQAAMIGAQKWGQLDAIERQWCAADARIHLRRAGVIGTGQTATSRTQVREQRADGECKNGTES